MKNKKNTATVNKTAERRNTMLRLQDLVDNPVPGPGKRCSGTERRGM